VGWRSVPLSARELWLEQVNRAAELRGPFDPDCQRLFGRLLAIANEVSNELTLVDGRWVENLHHADHLWAEREEARAWQELADLVGIGPMPPD